MTLPSKKNPPTPIGASADTGASSIPQEAGFLVDLGETGRDGTGPERDGFAIGGMHPELVGGTLGNELYFAGLTVR